MTRLLLAALVLLTAAGGEGGSAELAQCAQRTGEGTWVVGAAHKGDAALAAERCVAAGARARAHRCDVRVRREGGAEAAWAWAPEAVSACGLFPFTPQPMAVLLQDAWVGVLGDSTARLFYSALLRAAGAAPEPRVLQGHRGFQHPLRAGARASFGWAPYSENVTEALRAWHVAGSAPDVVVMGASLWHMLHVGDAGAHGEALERMLDVLALLSSKTGRGPLLFWMSTTALVNHKLLTEQKRTQLTAERASAYEAQAARLLAPAGPCLLLDLRRITHGAPPAASLLFHA